MFSIYNSRGILVRFCSVQNASRCEKEWPEPVWWRFAFCMRAHNVFGNCDKMKKERKKERQQTALKKTSLNLFYFIFIWFHVEIQRVAHIGRTNCFFLLILCKWHIDWLTSRNTWHAKKYQHSIEPCTSASAIRSNCFHTVNTRVLKQITKNEEIEREKK